MTRHEQSLIRWIRIHWLRDFRPVRHQSRRHPQPPPVDMDALSSAYYGTFQGAQLCLLVSLRNLRRACREAWFPDLSRVRKGTLWIARTPEYRDSYGPSDLLEVRHVTHSNLAICCHYSISHFLPLTPLNSGLPVVMPDPGIRAHYPARQIIRHYRPITPSKARSLGFDISENQDLPF